MIQIDSNSVVLVDCWAPWCNTCLSMMPNIDKLTKDFENKIKVIKANAQEEMEFMNQYSIKSLPTFLFFKNGEIIDRINGSVTFKELNNRLNSVL